MRGAEIVRKLGITHQAVRQLLIKLHAHGHITFGDPEKLFWIVMRAGDKTPLLSHDEERVLSVIPREYAADINKIRIAARLPEDKVQRVLERLLIRRLVEASNGLRENLAYRITKVGLRHPQWRSECRAQAPRLPVESDRVRTVLSAICESGELRIIDVIGKLNIPRLSMNALMQYLKRKRLVKKNGPELHAPYSLTAEGLAALTEMTRRRAA
jgi:DNA-binding IclR family transcriptional regulator